jgi:hypothetical protein
MFVDRMIFGQALHVVMTTSHVNYAPERGKRIGYENQPGYNTGSQD